jgi:menaquinone-dependent protoporphyrinogen IX oxidase
MGRWIKESKQFLEKNQVALNGKTALFVSCGDAAVPEKLDEAQSKYLDEVAQKHGIEPVSMGLFAGCYTWRKYNLFVKQLIKAILRENGAVIIDTSEPLDYRDWDSIESWARGLTLLNRS